jgi:broad specificity phosphatase PhoE
MGKIIFIRHGETAKNPSKLLHASNDPESLNDKGVEQIKKTASKLKELAPFKIISSKERRAIESGKIIAQALNVPLEEVEGMQERNWGIFTGKPWGEVKKVLDKMSLEERYKYSPPNGESWEIFETRLINSLKQILENNSDKTLVIVTHGGAIRALMPFLLNVSREESFKYDPDNASLSIFDYDGESFHLIAVNDTSHLQ